MNGDTPTWQLGMSIAGCFLGSPGLSGRSWWWRRTADSFGSGLRLVACGMRHEAGAKTKPQNTASSLEASYLSAGPGPRPGLCYLLARPTAGPGRYLIEFYFSFSSGIRATPLLACCLSCLFFVFFSSFFIFCRQFQYPLCISASDIPPAPGSSALSSC